jgi:hypothetical protein
MRNGDIGDIRGKQSHMRNRSGRIGRHLITKTHRMGLDYEKSQEQEAADHSY